MKRTTMDHPTGLVALTLPMPDALAVWGLPPAERVRRELAPMRVPVMEGMELPAGAAAWLLLRGDAIFHHSVLRGMIDHPDIALTDEAGRPLAAHVSGQRSPGERQAALAWLREEGESPAGLRRVRPADVASLYNARLRRRDDPYALRVSRENLAAIEKRLFLATYKGVTDLVTKYWWPVPARIATGWCVQLGLTPNFVTTVSGVLAAAVCFLFADGLYGLGLALGWVMTFLDTVDGKLARVTLTSSKFGDLLDHGIDLVHPLAWYYTWGMGLARGGEHFPPLMWILFGSYIAGRLCEGYFARRFGFHLHVWRRFDSAFRLVLARRNPNMIILTLAWAAGRPDTGLWLVAAWTAVTLAVHLVQVTQSVVAARRGPVRSWLELTPG
ncbi:MAG: CDP-alcohol phosphatidyltransferase family protein [Opitutaceae bacterium]|nr:CDP-alcohol phosphatidyltransferase family protein [Opitutaceae bacterium]